MPRLKDIKDPYRNESSNNIGRKQHPPLNEASSISPHGRHSLSRSLALLPYLIDYYWHTLPLSEVTVASYRSTSIAHWCPTGQRFTSF